MSEVSPKHHQSFAAKLPNVVGTAVLRAANSSAPGPPGQARVRDWVASLVAQRAPRVAAHVVAHVAAHVAGARLLDLEALQGESDLPWHEGGGYNQK